ncbi:unnamed protein product, partial [Rotaria sp. Silwood2]
MTQSQHVAHYISDSENDIDMQIQHYNNIETVKRKKKNMRQWVPSCTYNNKDGAINKIKNDGIWSKIHSNIISDGKRVYYRCNQYFSSEWLESKNGWYEGLAIYVPSTNNALEATSRVIKDEDTLRERLVLSRFTVVLFSIVNKWSKERNPTLINSKKFEYQPLIALSHWTDAYNWVKLNKEVISIFNGDRTIYYLPAGEKITITDKEIKRYETCRFNSTMKKYRVTQGNDAYLLAISHVNENDECQYTCKAENSPGEKAWDIG